MSKKPRGDCLTEKTGGDSQSLKWQFCSHVAVWVPVDGSAA